MSAGSCAMGTFTEIMKLYSKCKLFQNCVIATFISLRNQEMLDNILLVHMTFTYTWNYILSTYTTNFERHDKAYIDHSSSILDQYKYFGMLYMPYSFVLAKLNICQNGQSLYRPILEMFFDKVPEYFYLSYIDSKYDSSAITAIGRCVDKFVDGDDLYTFIFDGKWMYWMSPRFEVLNSNNKRSVKNSCLSDFYINNGICTPYMLNCSPKMPNKISIVNNLVRLASEGYCDYLEDGNNPVINFMDLSEYITKHMDKIESYIQDYVFILDGILVEEKIISRVCNCGLFLIYKDDKQHRCGFIKTEKDYENKFWS